MKKVENINSRRLFGEFYPQAPRTVPEGLGFTAVTLSAFVVPTLAYCYVTNQVQPLYAIACLLGLGALLGALLHWKRSHRFVSVETVEPMERSSKDADAEQEKDAA